MKKGKKVAGFALFLAALFIAGRFWLESGGIKRALALDMPTSLGMDTELQKLVKELEESVIARNQRQVSLKADPLKLSRIITNIQWRSSVSPEFREGWGKMRLSCTVLSPMKSVAIIKYKGKSHNLKVGDRLAGWRVVEINVKQVVMKSGGKKMILVNKPAPPSEIRVRRSGPLEELKL